MANGLMIVASGGRSLATRRGALDGVKKVLETAGLWQLGSSAASYMGSLYDAAEVPDEWEGSLKKSIDDYVKKNHPTVADAVMKQVDRVLADAPSIFDQKTANAFELRPMDAYDAVAHIAHRVVPVYDTSARYQEVRQLCAAIKMVMNQPDSFWQNVEEVLTAANRGGS